MPLFYNLGAIAALFSLCTPFSDGEMRILAPQNLVYAHADRPIASARFNYYGGTTATGNAVILNGEEICKCSCRDKDQLRDKVAGKIIIVARAEMTCSLGASYPFLNKLGAIGLVSFSEYPDPGIGRYRHHTWQAERYVKRPMVMPDVTFKDVLRNARGCINSGKDSSEDESDENQCIYGNCKTNIQACFDDIVDRWREIDAEENITLALGPPYYEVYEETFNSWYWILIFRILLPMMAFWTALVACLHIKDTSKNNGQEIMPTSESSTLQDRQHRCALYVKLCRMAAFLTDFAFERQRSIGRAWGVGRIISCVETPVMLLIGIIFAGGHFGPMEFLDVIHFIFFGLLNNLSNVSSLVLALYMRNTLKAQKRQNRNVSSLWVQYPMVIFIALSIAVFFDVIVPGIYYSPCSEALYSTLSLPSFMLLSQMISLLFLVLVGFFFVFTSWQVVQPLFAHISHPKSHQAASIIRKIKRLTLCLVASGLCMVMSGISMLVLSIQISSGREIKSSTLVVLVIYSFSRVGRSYFHVQSLIEPQHDSNYIFLSLPRFSDFRMSKSCDTGAAMAQQGVPIRSFTSDQNSSRSRTSKSGTTTPLESIAEESELKIDNDEVQMDLDSVPPQQKNKADGKLPLWGTNGPSIDALALRASSSSSTKVYAGDV